ncbi:hypothetical protein CORC01_13337 [Colletotrichum orchidophilum]|uniref:Siderophore biosynthesis enzyme n=1 Tax=Colletotrichum orchidophilum TaxID=1209926 RepID=A0A1G4AQB3_9PEZI|nr:uncharacterized protein CORC01_13337 [Colletotrichum orchidophilum]OHE91360.1 hypothetical protein CORC01_13337 [Colletotrichum orchidophilum]
MSLRFVTSLAIMATAVLARTDLAGCVSSDSVVTPTQGGTPYATRVWYVPGTGEICAALDCGGGRAPPKTTVPGCPSYEGTGTYSPSFLPLQTSAAPVVSTTVAAVTTKAPETTVSVSDSTAVTTSTDSAAVESQTSVSASAVVVITSSGFSNATMTTLTTTAASASGSQSSRVTQTAVSAATSGATNSPNAAVPTGASRQLFGLVAGVAIGAALL